MCSLCPVRGGILCKLWKAITDYRQKPTWGLKWRQPLREVRTFVPTTQYSPLTSVFIRARLLGEDLTSDGEQLSTHTRNSLTLRVGSILIILKKGFWKKTNKKKQGHFESNNYSEVPLVLLRRMDITQLFATGGLEMTTRRKTLKTFKKFSPVFTRCNVYKTWDWPFSNTSLRYKILHSKKSSVLMFLP